MHFVAILRVKFQQFFHGLETAHDVLAGFRAVDSHDEGIISGIFIDLLPIAGDLF